jgi:hypothetical protein
VVSGVVRRALGSSEQEQQQPHAVADALLGVGGNAADAAAADAKTTNVIVVLGSHLRTADLRSGSVMAPLHALVRSAGSAAVLPHVDAGSSSGGCRARAAARLAREHHPAARAFVFGCGGKEDAAASAAEAPAVLAAAGWTPAESAAPVLLIACTASEADAAADASAMAAAHDHLAAAVDGGASSSSARVSVLAVRPPAAATGAGNGRRRLHLQDEVAGVEEVAAAGAGGAGGAALTAAGRPVARGAGGSGGAMQYDTCDARCQSQVKWLQGILAAGVMLLGTLGGLSCLGALQGPSRFEKPHEQ